MTEIEYTNSVLASEETACCFSSWHRYKATKPARHGPHRCCRLLRICGTSWRSWTAAGVLEMRSKAGILDSLKKSIADVGKLGHLQIDDAGGNNSSL